MNINFCFSQLRDFIDERPEKISIREVPAPSVNFPKITVCSPAFFNKSKLFDLFSTIFLSVTYRLKQYGLDDVEDNVANYLILSLQSEQIKPRLEVIPRMSARLSNKIKFFLQTQKNVSHYAEMDARITQSMAQYNLTYLELLRKLAVDCDQFILFVRDKSFESDMTEWPDKYGHKIDNKS